MDIFIAGATGVMGRRGVPVLIEAGHQVITAGWSREILKAPARTGARTELLDLFDPAVIRRAVASHEVVINLATSIQSRARAFLPDAWRTNDHIRREVSANLVSAALAGSAEHYNQESLAHIHTGMFRCISVRQAFR